MPMVMIIFIGKYWPKYRHFFQRPQTPVYLPNPISNIQLTS